MMPAAATPLTNSLASLTGLPAAVPPLADAALFENLLMATALAVLPEGAAEPNALAKPQIEAEADAAEGIDVGDHRDPTLPDTLLALMGSTLPLAPSPMHIEEAQDVSPPPLISTALAAADEPPARVFQTVPVPAPALDSGTPEPTNPDSSTDPNPANVAPLAASLTPAVRGAAQIPDAPNPEAAPQTERPSAAQVQNNVAPTLATPSSTPLPRQPDRPGDAMPAPQSPSPDTLPLKGLKLDPETPKTPVPMHAPEKNAPQPDVSAKPAPHVSDAPPNAAPVPGKDIPVPSAPPRAPDPTRSSDPTASADPAALPPSIAYAAQETVTPIQIPRDNVPTRPQLDLPSTARAAFPLPLLRDAPLADMEAPDADPGPIALTGLAAPALRPMALPYSDASVAETRAAPLELSPDLAFLDRLSADISDMAREGGKLHFRLMPAHLGKLDIAVEAHGETVSVHMQTQSQEAKSLLTDAQSGLTQDLAARGLRLAETSVTLAGDGNLPRRNPPLQAVMIETETPAEADAGSPNMARPSGRFA